MSIILVYILICFMFEVWVHVVDGVNSMLKLTFRKHGGE